jgi:chromosomal replication initiator protein
MRDSSDVTFETFIPTGGTLVARRQSVAFARNEPLAPRLLVLHGPSGSGKTHLLRAVTNLARVRQPSARLVATDAAALIRDLVEFARGDAAVDPRDEYGRAEIVTVDDLHVLRGRSVTQRECALLIGGAIAAGARVACAFSGPPSQVPVLMDNLLTLPAARIEELAAPSAAEMRRIVRRLAAEQRMALPAPAVAAIAVSSLGDVRRASGALATRRLALSLELTPRRGRAYGFVRIDAR